jgi:bidirectional [NiFe] hydrogenase diaphorase subunit
VATTRHLKPGETTPDGELSLLTARCFGACGLAPVAVIDGAIAARLSPQALEEHIEASLTGTAGVTHHAA